MNVNDVIKYPILTEKSYFQMKEQNLYTFAVDRRTNKVEVRKAVEFIFNVKVEKVNIMTIDAKPKRIGRFIGKTNQYKKALVYLKDGSAINFFPEDVNLEKQEASEAKADEAAKEQEAKKASEVEKKVAEKLASKK